MSAREVTFTNGVVEIESITIVHDQLDVFIIEADMRSKYAQFAGEGSGGETRDAWLDADERTLYANAASTLPARITVRGLDGDGWLCVAECGRYTAIACWYRRPSTQTSPEPTKE